MSRGPTPEQLKALAALGPLAGMLRDRDLAQMAEATRAVQGLERQLDALGRAVAARSAMLAQELDQGGGACDPAAATGTDFAWLAGIERQRSRLRAQLIRARAAQEQARRAAIRALGRAQVLDRLAGGG